MIPQLIPATAKDIPTIHALGHQIWNEYYPPIIGQEQVDYMLNKLYNFQALKEQMKNGQQFYLVDYNGLNAGFIAISNQEKDSYFLHKFYLDKSLHGSGIGTKVFELLLAEIPNAKTIQLQVNRQNHKPINFYFKVGFIIEKVADFDIGDGYFMNDFVMIWNR